MVSQLRIYTINKGKLDDFVSGWTRFVHPLHYKFGFTIDRADVIRERNEFVWIVSYDGTLEDWKAKQAAYYGSSTSPRPIAGSSSPCCPANSGLPPAARAGLRDGSASGVIEFPVLNG